LYLYTAATTLHNFVRSRWPHKLPGGGERESLRMAILRALVVAPPGPVVGGCTR
jgi:ABC-type dipeptide/oligopeptide/nickel transport system ATPase subunit